MNTYSDTTVLNVRLAIASVSGKGLDSDALSGWLHMAKIVADDTEPRITIDAMTGDTMSDNVWTRVRHTIRLIGQVDDLTVADGTIALATEVVYMAASKAGKGRGVASVVNAIVKDGTRFATIDALATILKDERKGATAPNVGTDEARETADKTLDSEMAALLKRINRVAEDHDTDVFTILSNLADMAEAALDVTAAEDEAADEAALAS